MTPQIQGLRERIQTLETKVTTLQDELCRMYRTIQFMISLMPNSLSMNVSSPSFSDQDGSFQPRSAQESRQETGAEKTLQDVFRDYNRVSPQESLSYLNHKCLRKSNGESFQEAMKVFGDVRQSSGDVRHGSLTNADAKSCEVGDVHECEQENRQIAPRYFSFHRLERKYGHTISSLQMPTLDQTRSNSKTTTEDALTETKFYKLPEKVTALEVLHLWYSGIKDVPPIRQWSVLQKTPQKSKISRWKKIVDIFERKCKSDWQSFHELYKDSQGKLLPVSNILSLYNYEQAQTENGLHSNSDELDEDISDNDEDYIPGESQSSSSPSSTNYGSENPAVKLSYVLPKKIKGQKVSPVDVIKIWEKGVPGRIPPIKTWTSIQKLTQQSKVSRWKRIYVMYKGKCNGDMNKFRKLVTDSMGKVMSVATVCKLYC